MSDKYTKVLENVYKSHCRKTAKRKREKERQRTKNLCLKRKVKHIFREKSLGFSYEPGGALEEVVALAVHQLAAEPRHLVLHLFHLGVEALAYVGELGVDYAEITELDGNVALDTTVGHVFARVALSPSRLSSLNPLEERLLVLSLES